MLERIESNASRRRLASGALAKGWAPYLYEFHCPGFDVPLSLWNATDIIINKETFGCDPKD
jgi:hypothetical protein